MGAAWRLPGYDVFELVGFGGSGEVWRARVVGTGEVVALKRLRSADAVARERLRREAAVLSSVAGDHVVRVRDVVLTDVEAVLVMDFAAGGNLATVLSVRGQIAAPEVVTLVGPLAMALADAHDRGIVHGDVTPANIVFDGDGRPLLTDFGVARAVGTTTDVVEGTPPYVAPEVLAGAPATPAADVFSLCTVAREALALASAPDALATAIESGLADDSHDRPTARELASAVLRSCAAAPVGLVRAAPARPSVVTQTVQAEPAAPAAPAAPATPPAQRPRPTRRRKPRRRVRVPQRLVVAVVAAITLVLAVAGGVMWGHRTESSAATVAPVPIVAPTAPPSPSPTPSSSAVPTDWQHTVAVLEAARAHAFLTGSAAALDAVYAPRSAALAADRHLLLSLGRRGLRASGYWITTLAVRPVVVMPEQATLRVTDAIPAYALVDAGGHVVQTMATRSSRTFTMRLVRKVGAGWRISGIHA